MTPHRRIPALLTIVALAFPVTLHAQKTKTKPVKTPSATGGSTAKKKEKANPREVRVHLMDGSVVLGELSVDSIEVKTEFGRLTIPVEKILSITPGLDSHTKLSGRIKQLITELGDDDFKKREAAHKELLKLGPPIRDVLADYKDDKNAERKRHVGEIVAKLDEMISQQNSLFNSGDSDGSKTWTREDTVVTPKFTIVGDVSPTVFEVRSKYGPLKISLNDIRRTERRDVEKGATLKQIAVAGTNLMLLTPKDSGIRLKSGDTVTVAASGTLVLTPWGSSATTGPDGNTRYSAYTYGGQRYYSGTLVARIGNSGGWIRIGSRTKFVAKSSGSLKFGIAMYASYARGNYVFPGTYKVRIKVDAKD